VSLRGLWRTLLSRPRIWLVLLVYALGVLVGLIVLRAAYWEGPQAVPALATVLAASALIALLALAMLALRFYTGIREVRTHLFNGDYEDALEASRQHASVAVGIGFESAIQRLLDFDRRRAEKLASATRLLDRLLREAPAPILIGDIEQNTVRFSHAFRQQFGINDDRFALDALLRPAANTEFARLWSQLAAGDEACIEADLTLHLPVRQTVERCHFRLFAVQNDEGRIAYILGFASPVAPQEADEDDDEVTATE